MKKTLLTAALSLSVLFVSMPAMADPQDKDSRYLFLKEGNGDIVYVDSHYIKAISTPNGGLVEYFQVQEFKDKNVSTLYRDLKKVLKSTEEPVAMFSDIFLDCTLGRFKIKRSSISGYDLTDSTKKMKMLTDFEQDLDKIEWTVISGGLSTNMIQKVCIRAR
jgi:hypothetical protein